MSHKTILIAGSTGQQGGATAHAVLTSPLGVSTTVKGLTRNPASMAAQALQKLGARPTKGDLFDRESLTEALRGVDGAYLVTDFTGPKGVEGEVEQGKLFIDVAKEVGVKHIVFSSVGSADTAGVSHAAIQVPHFRSKLLIEEHLKQSGIHWTILRPCCFMDNIPTTGFKRFMALGLFGSAIGFGRKLDYIAVEDVGKVAAACLLSPEKYHKRVIPLAGESVSTSTIQDVFAKVTGSRPWALWLPGWLVRNLLPFDLRRMFQFFFKQGFKTDISSLRSEFPDLLTFEDWVRKQTARLKHV